MTSATLNGSAPPRATRPKISSTKSQDANGKKVEYASTAAWGDVYEAAAYEEGIRAEAEVIWADHGITAMTPTVFMRLWPLLRRPIHPGHVIATTRATGKPYDSDGVRSVQVLVDRMNNVLTPMWWRQTRVYESGATECLVTVRVFDSQGVVLAEGESWGGMERANTKGNLRKASYTNAAKIAFAAIGPAHEIYTQAIDYDPDLLPGAIEDQNRAATVAHAASATPPAPKAAPAAPPEPDPGDTIDTILMVDDDLAPLRKLIVDGLRAIGAGERQVARELGAAHTGGKRELEALQVRISNALDGAGE